MTFAAFWIGAASHGVALAVLVLQACLGARLIRLFGGDEVLSTRERLLFGWAAGFAVTTSVWMLLVGLDALGPATVAAVVVASAATAWPEALRLGAKCIRILRTADSSTRLAAALGLAILAFWAWPLWVESLLPNSDWDAALYHLPLADRYLEGHLFGLDPYFAAFSFPGAVHLLYAALMSVGLECAIAPLNFQVTVLTGLVAVVLARHIGGRRAAVWAGLAFATTPILWQLGLDARIDGFLALHVALAVYGLARFTQDGHDRHLVLSALALGAAIGCKYTAWLFVPAVALLALGFRLRDERGARGLTRLLATCAFVFCFPNLVWYGANLANHGDPFFPILRGNYTLGQDGEHNPLARAEQAIDAGLQDENVRAQLATISARPDANADTDAPAHLFNFVDMLQSPERYAVRPNHGIGVLLLLSLALPLSLPPTPERRRSAIVVWLLGWGSYAAFGSQIPLLRYAVPALPLLAATAGVALAWVPWRAARLTLAAVGVLLLARDHAAELRKLELMQVPGALRAASSPWSSPDTRLRWLETVGFNFTPPMAFVSREIAGRVERGEIAEPCRILMVGEGKGRLQPCDFLPDASWFGHRFLAYQERAAPGPDGLASSLQAEGVTHLLYNRAYYDWVLSDTDTHPTRVALLRARLSAFLERHGKLLFEAGGIELYAIARSAP